MIAVQGVEKYYGAHPAVRELDFEITSGECVGLLGLNGAGKSTTLKMLGCQLRPTSGSITIRGVSAEVDPQGIRQLIGFLPETPPLYGEMTARAYLAFAGGLRGMRSDMITRRIHDVAARCSLQRVLDIQISSLSHGFQQRIGIAQAILHRPALLILDEPTQGLDPVQIAEVRALIRSLRGDHTILLSTHILSEIEAVCDRILVLHEGRLAAQGTEAELVSRFGMGGGGGVEFEVRGDAEALRAALRDLQVSEGTAFELEIRSVDSDTVRARLMTTEDVRAALSRAVVKAGLDLLALRRTSSGLEEMFRNLDDDAPASSSLAGDA